MKKNTRRKLHGDENYPAGDFRSAESIALLKQADVVVTNPPFSLAREYIKFLGEQKKLFLIIGDLNWITYKEVFPLLKNNQMWLGYNSVKGFIQSNGNIKKFGNKLWFKDGHTLFHCLCSCEHFRNVNIVVLEFFTHFIHSGDHGIQNIIALYTLFKGFGNDFGHHVEFSVSDNVFYLFVDHIVFKKYMPQLL